VQGSVTFSVAHKTWAQFQRHSAGLDRPVLDLKLPPPSPWSSSIQLGAEKDLFAYRSSYPNLEKPRLPVAPLPIRGPLLPAKKEQPLLLEKFQNVAAKHVIPAFKVSAASALYYAYGDSFGPYAEVGLHYLTLGYGLNTFFGRDIRDLGLSYLFAYQLAQPFLYYAANKVMPELPVFLFNGGIFTLGNLGLGVFSAWESRQPQSKVSQQDLEASDAGENLLIEELEKNENLSKTLQALQNELVREETVLKFFGYDSKNFDLKSELSHLRVGECRNFLAAGYYMPFTQSLMLRKKYANFVIAHEMMHAFHHKAMMRGVNLGDLAKVCDLLNQKKGHSPFLQERLEKVEAYLTVAKENETIPDEIRWAGADLIFYYGLVKHRARLEVIGSYFDCTLGGVPVMTLRGFEKLFLSIAIPSTFFNGIFKSNIIIQSQLGYSNPILFKKFHDQGLMDSILW
jgi:hypothetical protein